MNAKDIANAREHLKTYGVQARLAHFKAVGEFWYINDAIDAGVDENKINAVIAAFEEQAAPIRAELHRLGELRSHTTREHGARLDVRIAGLTDELNKLTAWKMERLTN